MKCVYRKVTVSDKGIANTSIVNGTIKNTMQNKREEFADCQGADCPAYADGKCRRLEKELNHGSDA